MADTGDGQAGQTGQIGQEPLEAARRQAEQQVDRAIDEYASKVPGGQQAAQPAKGAARKAIDYIEKEATKRLNGLFKH